MSAEISWGVPRPAPESDDCVLGRHRGMALIHSYTITTSLQT